MTGLEQHLDAIDQLAERKLYLPAVSLMFVIVENLAWLESGDAKKSKTRFIDWVDRFLLPIGIGDLKAIDLYGARCAILHTGTSISDLSEAGRARRVNYRWGTVTPLVEWAANETAAERGEVFLRVEDLTAALHKAITRYFEDLEKAGERPDVRERLAKVFNSVSEKHLTAQVEERIKTREQNMKGTE